MTHTVSVHLYAVIEYLGRYTHKVEISNHRISSINDQECSVTFEYKDYSDGGKRKQMRLSAGEFIRRFSNTFYRKGLLK